ncbi:hypothetical protein AB4Z42_17190 [Mycobacterium sp. 2YAF39]|uniref:hypothetical protein n=1 Tax=Mycobacterium sp. 2YAF39 TaxID=3233033 RepID=UPI003F97813C
MPINNHTLPAETLPPEIGHARKKNPAFLLAAISLFLLLGLIGACTHNKPVTGALFSDGSGPMPVAAPPPAPLPPPEQLNPEPDGKATLVQIQVGQEMQDRARQNPLIRCVT